MYGLKYWYQFGVLDQNSIVKIEIHWKDFTGSAIKLESVNDDPLILSTNQKQNKYDPIISWGIEMNVISATLSQIADLYTSYIKQGKIIIKYNDNILLTGWINSEVFSEQFEGFNYPVQLVGHDGFNVLDRFYLPEGTGQLYGNYNILQMLGEILNKINEEYTHVNICTDIQIKGITLNSNEVFLQKLYNVYDNLYDESDNSLSYKEILERILSTFDLSIIQLNNQYWIYQINKQKDPSLSFNKYDRTLNYVNNSSVNIEHTTGIYLKWIKGTKRKDNEACYNSFDTVYSPYIQNIPLDYTPGKDDFSSLNNTDTHSGGITGWYEDFYNVSNNWNRFNGGKFCNLRGLMNPNLDVSEWYLKLEKLTPVGVKTETLSYQFKKQLPFVNYVQGYYFRLNISAFFRTKENLNDSSETGYKFKEGFIYCRMKCGSKKFVFDHAAYGLNYDKGSWVDLSHAREFQIPFYRWSGMQGLQITHADINDQWYDFKISKVYGNTIKQEDLFIPIPTSGGILEFELYSWDVGDYGIVRPAYKTNIKDVRINKISIDIVDSNYQPVAEYDLSKTGYISENYKNKGEEKKFFFGLGKTPIERAALKLVDNTYVEGFNLPEDGTVYYSPDELYLRDIRKNYSKPHLKLSGELIYINNNYCLQPGNVNPMSIIKDPALPESRFMVMGINWNVKKHRANVVLSEYIIEEITVNKLN